LSGKRRRFRGLVYRNSLRIAADILTITRDSDTESGGVGITVLLRKGNISYKSLSRLLKDLTTGGLIEEIEVKRGNRYRISSNGREFLQEYSKFQELAQTFGLNL